MISDFFEYSTNDKKNENRIQEPGHISTFQHSRNDYMLCDKKAMFLLHVVSVETELAN